MHQLCSWISCVKPIAPTWLRSRIVFMLWPPVTSQPTNDRTISTRLSLVILTGCRLCYSDSHATSQICGSSIAAVLPWSTRPAKYGVDVIAGSWPHPLGVSFGLVKPRPVAHQGMVVVRPTFSLSLNFDRAVMAGSQAAQFFRRIVEVLEHAELMAPYCSPLVEAPSHPHAPT